MAIPLKLQAEAYKCQIHPDLFKPSPQVELILKFWESKDDWDAKAEFWLMACDELNLHMPNSLISNGLQVTKYDENYNIDEAATIKEFARIVRWALAKKYAIEKDYEGAYFQINLTVPGMRNPVNFYTDRNVMCKKVHVGTEIIPATPERIQDKYDWECEKLSFLGVEV